VLIVHIDCFIAQLYVRAIHKKKMQGKKIYMALAFIKHNKCNLTNISYCRKTKSFSLKHQKL